MQLKENQKLWIKIIASTFIIGLIAHGFAYFNVYFTHDALYNITQNKDVYLKISSGRFLQPLNFMFRGYIVVPWLVGFLSLFWLSITNIILVKLLNIKKLSSIVLVCGFTTTNIALTLTNGSYLHEADSFMLSLMFAVLSVYAFKKFKYRLIIAPVLLACSIGFYQAYFQVAVVLMMIIIIKEILNNKKFEKILKEGVLAVLVLFLGLLVYSLAYRIVLFMTDIPASLDYNSLVNVGKFTSFSRIFELIGEVYQLSYRMFAHPEIHNPELISAINAFLMVTTIIQLYRITKQKRCSMQNKVLLLCLLVLFPFALNCVYFISNSIYHSLMIYALSLFYILIIVLMDYELPQIYKINLKMLVQLGLVLIIFNNIIYSNQLYLRKTMIYDITMISMNRVIDRMEQVDGYVVGVTPVVLIGELNYSVISRPQNGFNEVWGLGTTNFGITYSYQSYFDNVLAYPIVLLYPNDKLKQYASAMPSFPYEGYIELVDGVMIVKLS